MDFQSSRSLFWIRDTRYPRFLVADKIDDDRAIPMRTTTRFHLAKRQDGAYSIGWVENGTRRWKTTKLTTKSDALQCLREFKGQTQEAETIPTTSALLIQLTEVKGHSARPSSLILYRFSVERFIEVCGDRPIDASTPSDVDNYKTALVRRALTKPTVNIWHRSVKTIFGFAVRNGGTPSCGHGRLLSILNNNGFRNPVVDGASIGIDEVLQKTKSTLQN